MRALGITGGVGSGKSAVLSYLSDNYNIFVIFADDVAKELMKPGLECYDEIRSKFAFYDIFDDEGYIDRSELSKLVFSDDTLLKRLNDIVHPAVKKSIIKSIKDAETDGSFDLVLVEAALFTDDEYDDILEDYIFVYASKKTRIERLLEGRGYTEEKTLSIMDTQADEEVFRAKCKYVIDNDNKLNEAAVSADALMKSLGIKKNGEEDMSSEREYVFGLDIGTRNVVGTVGYMDDDVFRVLAQSTREHKSRSMLDGQIHDIDKVSKVVLEVKEDLEKKIDFELKNVCIAAAGRVLQTVTTNAEYEYPTETIVTGEDLYTLDLLGVDKAHRELTHDDSRYKFFCVGYTVMRYYLNDEPFTSREGHKAEKIAEDVIVTFLPEDVVDGLYAAVERAGLKVANLTLEPIAAINVAIPENFRMLNISLVDVGAGTSDICITDDGAIIAYGMIPFAGDELTEVLVKEYLVDFANAEIIKKAAATESAVTYTDIMGLEHTISAEEVWKVSEPVLEKITTAVCDKIIELNSGKPVAAVFVVGGGGKVHGFCEKISEKLGILNERVALRGEEVMKMVEFEEDIKKDPLLVTPIGICLNYFEQRNTFIMIRFNGELMKLYDNGNLKVVDAALQAGLSTEEIFPKRGMEIHFTVDGTSRMQRGGRGESAKVFMNGKEVGLNDALLPNCEILVEASTAGEGANLTIAGLPEYSESYVDFMVNNSKVRAPKYIEVNGSPVTSDYEIQDGDVIETKPFYTVGQLIEFMDVNISEYNDVLVNNRSASMDTLIYENFNIEWTLKDDDEPEEENITESDIEPVDTDEAASKIGIAIGEGEPNGNAAGNDTQTKNELYEKKALEIKNILEELEDQPIIDITVKVNGTSVTLSGKREYIFVDIYNYYEFDTESGRGKRVVTKINGQPCSFADALFDGDEIDLYWEDR